MIMLPASLGKLNKIWLSCGIDSVTQYFLGRDEDDLNFSEDFGCLLPLIQPLLLGALLRHARNSMTPRCQTKWGQVQLCGMDYVFANSPAISTITSFHLDCDSLLLLA